MGTVSVVVATFNRAALLDRCLSHLATQQFVPGDEVIVADNGSTDGTAGVVAEHARTFPAPLTRILAVIPGKSNALNSALGVANGDILAFTDDDVSVDREWVARLRRTFDDATVTLAGGPVDPQWERPAPAWLRAIGGDHARLAAPIGLLDYGPSPAPLGPRTLLGANMAIRRSVLVQLGGFATHLGKLRGTLLSGEDHELCQRVQAAGWRALYVPTLRVRHWVPAERMRLSYFLHWFYWSGITNATIEAQRHTERTRLGALHLLKQFAAGLAGAVASALRGCLPAAVDRALDSAFAVGYAARRWGLVALAGSPAPPPARSL